MAKQAEKVFIIIFALLNILSDSSVITASLPASAPKYDCCFFYSDTCGSTGSWYWSKENYYANENIDDCVWSDDDGAEWVSALQYNVTGSTLFTFQYNIHTPEANISISFKDNRSGAIYDVGLLTYKDDWTWYDYSFNCSSCCANNDLCDGQVIVTAHINNPKPNTNMVAIDNFGRDQFCFGSFNCCLFDDPSLCGCASDSQDGFRWLFSGDQPPTYPVPSSGSDFVYLEIRNNSDWLRVALQTPLITLYYGGILTFNCYIFNPEPGFVHNALYVYFHDVESGATVQVYATTSTPNEWLYFGTTLQFTCLLSDTCTGYLELMANVDSIDSHVVFAVDSLSMDYGCYVNPN